MTLPSRRRPHRGSMLRAGMLALTVLALPAIPAPAAEPFSEAQQNQIQDLVRDYILSNPEILIESLRGYEEKQRQSAEKDAHEAIATNREALERDPTSPVAGNPAGSVTVVEFFDYHCGYCKKVLPSMQELIETDKNVRVVFKEFPILGPDSVVASQAALAVWKMQPDKYLPFHVALMETRGDLGQARVMEIAKKVGIDPDKLKAAMADPAIKATIERNVQLARALQVNGTPAFVIGNQLVPGAIDIDTLRETVKGARSG